MKKVSKVIGITLGVIVVIGILIIILLKNTFLMSHPELKGEPEVDKWYRITPKDAKSSDGSEWHGNIELILKQKILNIQLFHQIFLIN